MDLQISKLGGTISPNDKKFIGSQNKLLRSIEFLSTITQYKLWSNSVELDYVTGETKDANYLISLTNFIESHHLTADHNDLETLLKLKEAIVEFYTEDNLLKMYELKIMFGYSSTYIEQQTVQLQLVKIYLTCLTNIINSRKPIESIDMQSGEPEPDQEHCELNTGH